MICWAEEGDESVAMVSADFLLEIEFFEHVSVGGLGAKIVGGPIAVALSWSMGWMLLTLAD
jgi:hypothetical protein